MSDPLDPVDDLTEVPLGDATLSRLRDVGPVDAVVRSRHIEEATRHLGGAVTPLRHERFRRLSIAAVMLLVVVGVGVLVTSRRQDGTNIAATAAERQSTDAARDPSADAARGASTESKTDDADGTATEGAAAMPTVKAESAPMTLPSTESTAPPDAGRDAQGRQAGAALGSFDNDDQAREAALRRYEEHRDELNAHDSSEPVACPLPPGLGTPIEWSTAVVAGTPRLVMVVRTADATVRALVADPRVCVWS